MRKKILLLGASGMLGSDVRRVFSGQTELYTPNRSEVDVCNYSELEQAILALRPDVVINCTAYTKVDQAEDEPQQAWQLNAEAVANMARICKEAGAWLIHISTDYVFDGDGREPIGEDAPCRPASVYGLTKRAGELACLAHWGQGSLVLRTSWLYGGTGANFVSTMLRLSEERKELSVINDQFGSPTSTADLADCLSHLVREGPFHGVWHASNSGYCSWYEFATSIISGWQDLGNDLSVERIVPITSADWPSRARRPAWSVLANRCLSEQAGYSMPGWQASLGRYLEFRNLHRQSGRTNLGN